MNTTTAFRMARQELDELGLSDWALKYDRARVRFGQCKHQTRTISLSRALVAANDEDKVLDTVRHEAAHALVGPGHGHDRVWKAKCLLVGAKPDRCYMSAEVVAAPSPLRLVCDLCGYSIPRQRRPRTTYQHTRDGGLMRVVRVPLSNGRGQQ